MSKGFGALRLLALAGLVSFLQQVQGQQSVSDPQRVEVTGSLPSAKQAADEMIDVGVPTGSILGVPIAMGLETPRNGWFAPVPAGTGMPAPTPSCRGAGQVPAVQPLSGHPVVLSTGSKYLSHHDFPHASNLSLALNRTYRSDLPTANAMFGSN